MKRINIEKRLAEIAEQDNREIKFWDFVKHINWSRNSWREPEDLYRKALAFCKGDKELLRHFEEIGGDYYWLINELTTEYMITNFNEEWDGDYLPCGDDDRMDLMWHIVGLGEEKYMKYVYNNTLVSNRCWRDWYEESFHYIWSPLWKEIINQQ